jgi:hypothetical protein
VIAKDVGGSMQPDVGAGTLGAAAAGVGVGGEMNAGHLHCCCCSVAAAAEQQHPDWLALLQPSAGLLMLELAGCQVQQEGCLQAACVAAVIAADQLNPAAAAAAAAAAVVHCCC